MGVTGLWKLIEPCGKPVPVETLDGKILAVDISIWLHQVIKGFQDNKGSALPNAHLLGLFHRLCKLLYYRVRPIFVFDGCVPQLKRDTIARRQQQRSKLNNEADRIQALLLQSLAKEKVVQQALGAGAIEQLLKSPAKRLAKVTKENELDELFKIPESRIEEIESDFNENSFNSFEDETATTIDEDSSFEERQNPHSAYNANLQAIDVRSQHFRSLPADVRHEILVDIKETRKQSSWGRLHELPSKSDDFSSFQMKRLLKRRAVQESLEEAEQEMGGRTITYNELKNMFTEEGIIEPTALEQCSKQISSDENTRFLLVRDLTKKLIKINENSECDGKLKCKKKLPAVDERDDEMPCTSKNAEKLHTNENSKQESDVEKQCKADLELAIKLSFEDSRIYSQSDYKFDVSENLRLNTNQRKHLKNAAIGPARAYMIEYAGMNQDEVVGIMETTQVQDEEDVGETFLHNEFEIAKEKEAETFTSKSDGDKNIKCCDETSSETKIRDVSPCVAEKKLNVITVSDSETDSDLEEVKNDDDNDDDEKDVIIVADKQPSKKCLQIKIDVASPIKPEDDIFADVFESIKIPTKLNEAKKSIDDSIEENEKIFATKTEVIKNDNVDLILNEIKKQVDDVKNISLEDVEIKVDKSNKTKLETEIIEIYDSDNAHKSPSSSSTTKTKSPKQTTPNKNKSINDYFKTEYLIKRTPEKVEEKEEGKVKNVKSPFFVKRTPKSKLKQKDNTSPAENQPSEKKVSKAARMLFTIDNNEEKPVENSSIENNNENAKIQTIEDPPEPQKNSEDYIKEAAETLKELKSESELQALAADLQKERQDLETERNRQDRMGMSINRKMSSECQELLRLFGIPYIIAPMEAEAQCAFLDAVELTNGTITDDSDIWLFGGRTVYKNFFAQNKHVLEFRDEQIKKCFNCDRKTLIQLACLVGSDYTIGIHGIGAVTALEILASFSTPKTAQLEENLQRNAFSSVLTTLKNFRDWWQSHKQSINPSGSSAQIALSKKLKNIALHDGFPSIAVIEAYLQPQVDESKETFSWGYPNVESLHEFAKRKFGWTTSKTDDILQPVLKKLNEKRTQATIKNYFQVKSVLTHRELQVSKRVKKAIKKMSGDQTEDTPDKVKPPQRKRQKLVKNKEKVTAPEFEVKENESETKTNAQKKPRAMKQKKPAVTKSKEVANNDVEKNVSINPTTTINARKRKINLPNTKEWIPQKEKDLEEIRKNKEKAIAILKKSKSDVAAGPTKKYSF